MPIRAAPQASSAVQVVAMHLFHCASNADLCSRWNGVIAQIFAHCGLCRYGLGDSAEHTDECVVASTKPHLVSSASSLSPLCSALSQLMYVVCSKRYCVNSILRESMWHWLVFLVPEHSVSVELTLYFLKCVLVSICNIPHELNEKNRAVCYFLFHSVREIDTKITLQHWLLCMELMLYVNLIFLNYLFLYNYGIII